VSDPASNIEHMFAEVVEIRERLASLVDRLDPDAVSGSAARAVGSAGRL
jgi:hypothetical protein